MRVPDDWELLQFSMDPARGSLYFADRYRYRFQLSWSRLAGIPDFDRMLADYRESLKEDQGLTQPVEVVHGAWRGLAGVQDKDRIVRFGRYFPGRSLLLEAVWIDPGLEEKALCPAMLDALGVRDSAEQPAVWQCFGMRLQVPPALTLQECTVQPANARMVFGDDARRARVVFSRLGMLDFWLRGEVEDWLRTRAPGKALRWDAVPVRQASHRGVKVRAVCRPGSAVLRRQAWAAEAWKCPEDGRLYAVAREGRTRGTGGSALFCCDKET